MTRWFTLVQDLRRDPPVPKSLHPALTRYQTHVVSWFNTICEHGAGSLSRDAILDLADQVRQVIDGDDDQRFDDYGVPALLTASGRLHPRLRQEETRFIPFLFHLVRPIALHRLMAYSPSLVSMVSMNTLVAFSRGVVQRGDRLWVLPPPGYHNGDPDAIMMRNDVFEIIAHDIAARLYESAVTEDELAATLRHFWMDLDDELPYHAPDLKDRVAAYNRALGLSASDGPRAHH